MKLIEIPLSKVHLFIYFFLGLAFVAFGYFIFTYDASNLYAKGVGVVCMAFFGVVSLFIFKKLFDQKVGLIINQTGLIDNSSAVSVGQIEWKDVTDIQTIMVQNIPFVLVFVKNPEAYLNRFQNRLSQKMAQINFRLYGSPITISSVSLKCSFKELDNWIRDSWEMSKKSS